MIGVSILFDITEIVLKILNLGEKVLDYKGDWVVFIQKEIMKVISEEVSNKLHWDDYQ
jgi:hypothetical protein